jgi:hypothetical protein
LWPRLNLHQNRRNCRPAFKFVQWDGKLIREIPRLRMKPGARPDPATFKAGCAKMAIESWNVFDRLQNTRVIPAAATYSRGQ